MNAFVYFVFNFKNARTPVVLCSCPGQFCSEHIPNTKFQYTVGKKLEAINSELKQIFLYDMLQIPRIKKFIFLQEMKKNQVYRKKKQKQKKNSLA